MKSVDMQTHRKLLNFGVFKFQQVYDCKFEFLSWRIFMKMSPEGLRWWIKCRERHCNCQCRCLLTFLESRFYIMCFRIIPEYQNFKFWKMSTLHFNETFSEAQSTYEKHFLCSDDWNLTDRFFIHRHDKFIMFRELISKYNYPDFNEQLSMKVLP